MMKAWDSCKNSLNLKRMRKSPHTLWCHTDFWIMMFQTECLRLTFVWWMRPNW